MTWPPLKLKGGVVVRFDSNVVPFFLLGRGCRNANLLEIRPKYLTSCVDKWKNRYLTKRTIQDILLPFIDIRLPAYEVKYLCHEVK